jgi:hypothetical protein
VTLKKGARVIMGNKGRGEIRGEAVEVTGVVANARTIGSLEKVKV